MPRDPAARTCFWLRDDRRRSLSDWSDTDRRLMGLALRAARRGRGRTHPNPRVGAVIARRGQPRGIGWHRRFGAPHAEIEALQQARGDTLYVTLEPCAHEGKTPPCGPAIVAAGVERVVVATLDPDRRMCGRGVRLLEQSGIRVEVGLFQEEARRINRPYFVERLRGRAHLTLKLAVSADGRLAVGEGLSQWISGEPARRLVRRWRRRADAVVVGVGTVLADDPLLTTHSGRKRQPVRIILDPLLETPPAARVVGPEAPTILVATPAAPAGRRDGLESAGARIWDLPATPDGLVDLRSFLTRCAETGLFDLFCEGGRQLATSLVREDCLDLLILVQAPRLLGGDWSWLGETGITDLAGAKQLSRPAARRVGDDLITSWPVAATEQLVQDWQPGRRRVHRSR
ncbi:MAG: bifunctional diaminohydroxyphosphoribosylaminopyrimidine deaminase/5-amino-6-(5-phosphoribosylamino)uracil reductase RibD [Candidatus Eisenbacteria bacterium]|nr:bifunctional diaminohydroxyphosphoribosylaminopyrimidine deaminase/5-amino-6-(5-phosphoribosylamino)uracil reductase RibD [Candidatus Eisenbacteria bacterium]